MSELNNKILKDYLLGKQSEEESRTILEWIKESDENREHLFKMEQLYHLGHFDKYENSKRVDRAEKRLMSRIESLAEVRSRRFSINRYMRYAAIIVLMLLLGGIGVISYQRLTAENMLVAQATNGVKNVILPDGTKVWLHHHASIKYPEQFSADERRVELNGEAYFEVKKNPKQPFIVNSDAMSVRVLGTIFNFNTKSGMHKEEVSLLQGSVEASGNAEEGKVILAPGQKAVLDKQSHRMIVEQVNADLDAVWHDNLIPLRNANIKDIVQILERFYHVHITIATDINKELTYSGVIKQNNTIDSVLSALSYSVPIRYKINGENVYLENK